VEHAVVVQVRKRNVSKSFPAQVLCIGLECDLAVLTVPSDEFWVGVHAIKLEDELVEVLPTFPFQDPISLYSNQQRDLYPSASEHTCTPLFPCSCPPLPHGMLSCLW
jgi:hypothetical protein